MPRVSLRRVGEASGCIAKLPASFGELLATADTKLLKQPGSSLAKRVFAASGDEILEDDFELIEHDDVLYVSCGEEWAAPPPAAAPAAGASPFASVAAPPAPAAMDVDPAPAPRPASALSSLKSPSAAAVTPSKSPLAPSSAQSGAPASSTKSPAPSAAKSSPAAAAAAESPDMWRGMYNPAENTPMRVDGEASDGDDGDDDSDDDEELDDDMYEVEAILAKRVSGGTSTRPLEEYLVSWKGYTAAANTWEPLENILDPDLIQARASASPRRPPGRLSRHPLHPPPAIRYPPRSSAHPAPPASSPQAFDAKQRLAHAVLDDLGADELRTLLAAVPHFAAADDADDAAVRAAAAAAQVGIKSAAEDAATSSAGARSGGGCADFSTCAAGPVFAPHFSARNSSPQFFGAPRSRPPLSPAPLSGGSRATSARSGGGCPPGCPRPTTAWRGSAR